jgi:hypothetical protein
MRWVRGGYEVGIFAPELQVPQASERRRHRLRSGRVPRHVTLNT